jgi:hypothetical protein
MVEQYLAPKEAAVPAPESNPELAPHPLN